MHPLDKQKLAMYRAMLGSITVDEALDAAIYNEQIAKNCGVHDTAFRRFARDAQSYLTYAELIEQEALSQ